MATRIRKRQFTYFGNVMKKENLEYVIKAYSEEKRGRRRPIQKAQVWPHDLEEFLKEK